MPNLDYKELYRPTYAKVHLDFLGHNLLQIKKNLPRGVKIMPMIKADGYGHGAVKVGKRLQEIGAETFGVATVEEGIELREGGIDVPILVMGGLLGMGGRSAIAMIDYDLTAVVHSSGVVELIDSIAKSKGKKVHVHIKVDTGMNRLGLRSEFLDGLLQRLSYASSVSVEGVMTHFAQAGKNKFTRDQIKEFKEAKEKIESSIGPVKIWHSANSRAILDDVVDIFPKREIWVRPGIALFGGLSGLASKKRIDLKSVMQLVSHVVLIKKTPKGAKVSYDSTYTLKRDSLLAVIPIGYADGYPWSLSNKAQVLVNGVRANVVGRVTMDMIVVDVTDVDHLHIGSEVLLMGYQDDDHITVDQLSTWSGRIPYEIFCSISKRMPRVYVG